MNCEDKRVAEVCRIFPDIIRTTLTYQDMDFNKLQEIRLRINQPLICIYDNREVIIHRITIIAQIIRETMEHVSNYSLYAFEEEIRQGFITITGGHRVGIAGKTIIENGYVKTIKYISFINVRLSHQIKGCSDKVFRFAHKGDRLMHTLIISPPGCGKTTLLRDMIRQISNGTSDYIGQTVGVVDERSEIGACYMGTPQNDLGIRTDVLDCCPKDEGMIMMIRSMSPKVIAVDEIGKASDIEAIEYIINCGCTVIGSVHGDSYEDIKQKPILNRLISEKLFNRFIILSKDNGVGTIKDLISLE